jgi:DNA-nicking Smr family endonuclease
MEDFSNIINDWLDRHPPETKEDPDPDDRERRRLAADRRSALRRMKPQATLDLHGHTISAAIEQIDRFLEESKSRGLQKVLLIHGKGIHSQEGSGTLKGAVREHARSHRLTGETGVPDRTMGGEGAFWVILR